MVIVKFHASEASLIGNHSEFAWCPYMRNSYWQVCLGSLWVPCVFLEFKQASWPCWELTFLAVVTCGKPLLGHGDLGKLLKREVETLGMLLASDDYNKLVILFWTNSNYSISYIHKSVLTCLCFLLMDMRPDLPTDMKRQLIQWLWGTRGGRHVKLCPSAPGPTRERKVEVNVECLFLCEFKNTCI